MSHAAISVTITLTEINCGECGGTYAINERYRKQKYDNSGTWHCPYCDVSWGYVEGEVARLQKRVENETKKREWAEQDAKNERAEAERQRKSAARLKRRVNAGVCPHCHRTVNQMARHIETKHPDANAA